MAPTTSAKWRFFEACATPCDRGLMERATRFELATFSLATVPWVMRRVGSGLDGMRLNRALDTFYAVFAFPHLEAC